MEDHVHTVTICSHCSTVMEQCRCMAKNKLVKFSRCSKCADLQSDRQPPPPRRTHGIDVDYFSRELRALITSLPNRTPEELRNYLSHLADVASSPKGDLDV